MVSKDTREPAGKTLRRALVLGLPLVVLASATAIAYADVSHQFIAGEVLTHTNLNDNFQDLDARITALETVSAAVPPGTVIAYAGSTVPTGWLLCDGAAKSRTQYSALFDVIQTSHGDGDGGTTFDLPDYRGRFLRGVDVDANRDPDHDMRTASAPGGNSKNNVGSVQDSEFRAHNHTVTTGNTGDDGCGFGAVLYGAAIFATGGGTCSGIILAEAGGNETRPRNVYVSFLIKY